MTTDDGAAFGFRYDPQAWAQASDSLAAAMVRCHVLGSRELRDIEQIRAAMAELVADCRESVSVHNPSAQPHDLIQVSAALGLTEAAELGRVILDGAEREEGGRFDAYSQIALSAAGLNGEPEVQASIAHWTESVRNENPWHTCPWGAFLKMRILWLGRDVVDTMGALEKLVGTMDGARNAIGAVADKDPWSFVDVAGWVDLPCMADVVQRFVPVILRAQKDDGGWGEASFKVFRALACHGLVDALRDRSALPPDWRVVRTIPAPAADLRTMAWDGEQLWLCAPKEGRLLAVSSADGAMVRTLDLGLEKMGGIGWWDGALSVTRNEPKDLLRIDPETGEVLSSVALDSPFDDFGGAAKVGEKIWVCDCFMPCAWELDPAAEHAATYRLLGGPGPLGLCTQEDSAWHYDWLLPLLIRSGPDGRLLGFGEVPFDGAAAGIAFDGAHLWVLDNTTRRICMLARA
jgi:hypothetical protein